MLPKRRASTPAQAQFPATTTPPLLEQSRDLTAQGELRASMQQALIARLVASAPEPLSACSPCLGRCAKCKCDLCQRSLGVSGGTCENGRCSPHLQGGAEHTQRGGLMRACDCYPPHLQGEEDHFAQQGQQLAVCSDIRQQPAISSAQACRTHRSMPTAPNQHQMWG